MARLKRRPVAGPVHYQPAEPVWSLRPAPAPTRPMSSIKRILVTGGAGFLGSHLCERLVAEASKRVPRRLITQKQFEEIKRLSENQGPGGISGRRYRPSPEL